MQFDTAGHDPVKWMKGPCYEKVERPLTIMSCPFLRLFRCELKFYESLGDFRELGSFLDVCSEVLRSPEQRTILALETARYRFWVGDWEQCLECLDSVGAADHLLCVSDRSLYYLVSGNLHTGYGDLNQALVFFELAVSEAESVQGSPLNEALIALGALFHRLGERERGNEFLDRARLGLEREPNTELRTALSIQEGLLAFRGDLPLDAEGSFQRALASLANPDRASILRGELLRYLGVIAATDGRPKEALKYHQDALQDFASLPYPLGSAKTYNSVGQTCLRLSRFEEARFFFEKAEKLCRDLGAEAERATILGKLGRVYAQTGEYEKAIVFQKQDLEASSRFGNYRAMAYALRNLGLSYRAKRDFEKAITYLRDSRNRFAELEDPTPQLGTEMDLVSTLIENHRWDEARGYLRGSQSLLDKRLEPTPDQVHAHYYGALLSRQLGDDSTAETQLWQALELSKSFSLGPRQAEIHFELAEIFRRQRDPEAAVEHFVEAHKLARSYVKPALLFSITERLEELNSSRLFELLGSDS